MWYGGFIGGAAAIYLNGLRKQVPARITCDLGAPALAVGYALGRVGCFLVQDDYGVPTSLPWGMKFPEGLPPSTALRLNSDYGVPIPDGVNPLEVLAVHPTQLYEAAAMLVVFWALWRLRTHTRGAGWLFGAYLLFAGIVSWSRLAHRAMNSTPTAAMMTLATWATVNPASNLSSFALMNSIKNRSVPANSR